MCKNFDYNVDEIETCLRRAITSKMLKTSSNVTMTTKGSRQGSGASSGSRLFQT